MRYSSYALPLFICAALSVSGCTRSKFYNIPDKLKPMPWIFNMAPQNVSAQFKAAWKDGCESGLSSMTNSYYRSNYKFRMDPALRKDPEYYKVWKDTYNFCRHYAYGRLRESDQRFRLQNRVPITLEKVGAHTLLKQGPLNFWGTGWDGAPLENFGVIGGDPYVVDGMGAHANWDFSAPHYTATTGLQDALNWDLRPSWGFAW